MKTLAVAVLVVALLAPGAAGFAWIETEPEEQQSPVKASGDEWDIGRTAAITATLCCSVFMRVSLRKADGPIEKTGLLLWTLSLPVFAVMVLWEQFWGSAGRNLIGAREDDLLLLFGLYGMFVGFLLRVGFFQLVVHRIIHLAKTSEWRP